MKIKCHNALRDLILIQFILVATIVLFIPSIATSGTFSVSPIKLVFEKGAKSGIIHVKNEGDEALVVQVKAFEWKQNQEGKDQYVETDELIFFPKMMSIKKDEERILRAGIKVPATVKEKTYRLFIEEIPGSQKDKQGSQVQVAIRFGVPIFVKPINWEIKGEIDSVTVQGEKIMFALNNRGNVHFIIQSILIRGLDIKGVENFKKELSGWYLLSGATRTYESSISKEECRGMSKVEIEVKSDQLSFNGKLDVDNNMCLP